MGKETKDLRCYITITHFVDLSHVFASANRVTMARRCGLLDAAANKKRVECNVCGLVMGRVGRSLQQWDKIPPRNSLICFDARQMYPQPSSLPVVIKQVMLQSHPHISHFGLFQATESALTTPGSPRAAERGQNDLHCFIRCSFVFVIYTPH